MIGNHRKEAQPLLNIIVKRVKPVDISNEDYQSLGLVELVALGYGFTGTEKYLLEQAQVEYYDGINKEDGFDIFFAIAGDKVVGSLGVIDWSSTRPKRDQRFWNNLQSIDPLLYERAQAYSPHAFEVGGIVTHPHFRNTGIARRLLQEATIALRPSVVLGQTKTPAAVLVRANTLRGLDYRTFYGEYEVTAEIITEPHFSPVGLINAHLGERGKRLDKLDLIYTDTDTLLPNTPDIFGLPLYIQQAFSSVVERQKIVGDTKTAVKPLISVYKSII